MSPRSFSNRIVGLSALAVSVAVFLGSPAEAAKPVKAPDTVIDSLPPAVTNATGATFAFHSTVAGSSFVCKLDAGAPTACVSPASYTGLTEAKHTFSVYAISGGVSDPSPATASWMVDLTAPSVPGNLLGSSLSPTSVGLTWTASVDTGGSGLAGYALLRDGAVLATVGQVTSYIDGTVTAGSTHTYALQARDAAGNVSAQSGTASVTTAAPSAYDPHLTRAPYLTDLVGLNVTVNFATDRSGPTASVTYGQVVSGSCVLGSVPVTASRVTLAVGSVYEYQWQAKLTLPSTGTYCYRPYLGSTDLLGTNPSPQFQTQVPLGSTSSYSFVVLGDWGQVDANGVNQNQANLMSLIARSGARFALSTGDNGYPSGSQQNYGDLQQSGADTSGIFGPSFWTVPGSSIPMFAAIGNHGLARSDAAHPQFANWPASTAVATSGGRYQIDTYPSVNGSAVASYPSAWYAFDAGIARFYVLDAAWADLNAAPGNGTGTPYTNEAASHWTPTSPEYVWLKNDLAAHPSGLKFAVFHYPMYSDQPSESSDLSLQGSSSLQGLLTTYSVNMAFSGHAHIYQRSSSGRNPSIVYYTTGGGGGQAQSTGACSGTDNYAIGWSYTKSAGTACGAATKPTSDAQVYHFLKVTVSGSSVTVAPTDSTGRTFDVQTFTFNTLTDTYIDSAPPAGTTSSTATFAFHASTPGATFTCSLDGGAATACTSPVNYTGLAQRAHSFAVYATVNKKKDPIPATVNWTVDSTPPTAPGAPAATTPSPFSVGLAWTAATDNTGVTGYDLYRDGVLYQSLGPVTSYTDTAVLGSSTHTYYVQAHDIAGNLSPASGTVSATTPPPPTPIFADGFETGDVSAWTSTGGLVVENTARHGGAYAAQGNTTTGATYAKKTLPGTYADAYARAWFTVIGQPDQVDLLRLRDDTGASLGYLYVETTGQLGYHNDATGTNTLSTISPAPGWHCVELHRLADPSPGTTGAIEVWLDNALVADLSSTAIDTGTAPVAAMQIGGVQGGLTYNVVFDDAAFGTSRLGPAADTNPPSVPGGLTATATSPFSARVSWSASTDDVAVSSYEVFRDGASVTSVPATALSWVDTTPLPGSIHTYAVRAWDLSGNPSAQSAAVTLTQPLAATPLFVDGFEAGDTSLWTTSGGLTAQAADVRSGAYAAEGNTTAGATYAKKTLPATYGDAYARTAFFVKSQTSQVTLLRLRDTPTGNGGYLYLTASGRLAFRSDALTSGTVSSVTVGPGWHAIELHLFINGTASVVETWLDGVVVSDLTFASIDLGSSRIGVLQIGDTVATAGSTWDVVFDDAAFGVSRLGPSGDVTAPSTPGNVTATATSAFSVLVGWDPSTDDIGVTGYDVFRNGTLLATVDGAVGTYTDQTVVNNATYAYAVRARDAANNLSATSAPTTVTMPSAGAPVFADGFETGDLSQWTSSGGLVVTTATGDVRTGSTAVEGNTTVGNTYAKKTLPSTYTDAYLRLAYELKSAGSQVNLLRVRDSAGASLGYLYLDSSGRLGMHIDATNSNLTSTVVPGAGWHVLEWHVVLNGSASTSEVWLDGVSVAALTTTGLTMGAGPIAAFQIGETQAGRTYDVVFDDAAFSTSRVGP